MHKSEAINHWTSLVLRALAIGLVNLLALLLLEFHFFNDPRIPGEWPFAHGLMMSMISITLLLWRQYRTRKHVAQKEKKGFALGAGLILLPTLIQLTWLCVYAPSTVYSGLARSFYSVERCVSLALQLVILFLPWIHFISCIQLCRKKSSSDAKGN